MTPLGHYNEYFAVFWSLKFRLAAVVTVVDYNNARTSNFRNKMNRPYQPLYIRDYSTPLERGGGNEFNVNFSETQREVGQTCDIC